MANDLFQDTGAERAYTASSIEVLEGLEPVRKRPGMYIGGTDERALHHLVAEVLDNAMDEAVAGHASRIEIEMLADGSVAIAEALLAEDGVYGWLVPAAEVWPDDFAECE